MRYSNTVDSSASWLRGLHWLAGLAFITLMSAGCDDSQVSSRLEEGPGALLDAWVAMWNSYELDRVHTLFLDDARLSYFSSEREGVIRGMTALVEHHEGFGFAPGGAERASRLWLEELHIDQFGDAAVATAIWFFQSAAGAPGEPQRGPVTFVCVRESGEWRFAHMNFSEYLPADSI